MTFYDLSAVSLRGKAISMSEYKDKVVLVVPGDEKSIEGGCVLNYGVKFQMFSKIDVNGKNEHPIYNWLKCQKKGRGTLGNAIKWNFTKFLIDRQGNVAGRYSSMTTPEQLDNIIAQLL